MRAQVAADLQVLVVLALCVVFALLVDHVFTKVIAWSARVERRRWLRREAFKGALIVHVNNAFEHYPGTSVMVSVDGEPEAKHRVLAVDHAASTITVKKLL